MPQMVADIATSMGTTLTFDSHTPGGQRLLQHAVNPTSLAKISADDWDYVVLQGQSQEGAFPDGQLASEVYPYATILNDSVKSNNECSETMFFMTWGRENGDQSNCGFYPPFCTYDGMQSRLRLSYTTMADQNDGSVAPVGEAWRYLRVNHPTIDLYSPDESHPSVQGSYLAACVFYVSIFRESVVGSTYISTLSPADAAIIQNVASMTVLDSLSEWNIGAYDADANFTFHGSGTSVNFVNTSLNGVDYSWDFADGNTSMDSDPMHTYVSNGTYNVRLIANNGCTADTIFQSVDLSTLSIDENEKEFKIYTNENHIKFISDLNMNEYEIYSMNGKKVMFGHVTNKEIDITTLDKGVYILRLINGAEFLTQRFMK
jgi:hypothetical protein